MVCGTYLKNRERATGKQLCDTLSAIPALVAPALAAYLIAHLGGLSAEGIRPIYFFQALGFLSILIFLYKFYFDTVKFKTTHTHVSFLKDIQEIFKEGIAVKPWIIHIFLSSSTMYINATYLSAFITEIKLGDEFVVAAIATASMIAPLLLALIFGKVADTFGRKTTLYITIPLYCISVIILILAQDLTLLLISGVLQGFFLLSGVTQGAVTAELVPSTMLGRWYGLMNLFRGLASMAAPILGGVIWWMIGPAYVFLSVFCMEIAKLIILWLAIPETLHKSPRVPKL